jgi:putative Mg2+ transporter-C (MgtC) family protein
MISAEQIAARLALAALASCIIGLNRDERGHPAGMRTTMLVCLAATLAQLQVSLLLGTSGKTPSSFAVLDLERLPLGILSGIGFIGAGVILKRGGQLITGVTTAATLWFVTVLGLLFGGGQLALASCATVIAILILWALKYAEKLIPREHRATIRLAFSSAPDEPALRKHLCDGGCRIRRWRPTYAPPGAMSSLECEIGWLERAAREPRTPHSIRDMSEFPSVISVMWEE